MISTNQKFIVVTISLLIVVALVSDHSKVPQLSLNKSLAATVTPQTEPLLQKSDLTYIGSFRVPDLSTDLHGATHGFDYTATGLAYNPANNSLFMNNHIYEQKTAEISIPALSTDLSNLNRATMIQDFGDLTEGNLGIITSSNTPIGNGAYMGGLMVYNDKLIGTSFGYYDAGFNAIVSHFTSSLNTTAVGDFRGMYKVGDLNPGFYAGYMTQIPTEWQSILGGPAITGLCCIAIISRSSLGPAAFVFDPDDLGVKNPVPATPLVYYDINHPTLGTWTNQTTQNFYYNMASGASAVAFPAGSRSVLFFGTIGAGVPCYGGGTADASLDRQPEPGYDGTVQYCYDPANASKASHAYPYKYWVWAYDANDLASVKNGTKNPWEVIPYAVWGLDDLNGMVSSNFLPSVQGVAYDSVNQKLYIAQPKADMFLPGASPYDADALISVYHINLAGGEITPPPPPPTTLVGDLNHDGIVNSLDWSLMNSKWFTTDTTADLNHDGLVNAIDFSLLNANWFKTVP